MKFISKIIVFVFLVGGDIYSQPLSFEWAKKVGGPSHDQIFRSVQDSLGFIYSVGEFNGTADFDPGPGTFNLTGGSNDLFLQKLDSNGNFVWAVTLGDYVDWGPNISIDDALNVYLAGEFGGTTDFDPGAGVFNVTPIGSGSDIFILKLDYSGNFIWVKTFGSASDDNIGNMKLDEAGDIYTSGSFGSTIDFDPGVGVYSVSSGGPDLFLQKLDSGGNFIWAKTFGTNSGGSCPGFCLDKYSQIYLMGEYDDAEDFDPGPGTVIMTPLDFSDVFVLKLDSDGNFIWVRSFGEAGSDAFFRSFGLDSLSNIYLVGGIQSTFDFDPGPGAFPFTPTGGGDIFICKLDSLGNFVWLKSMGGASSNEANQVQVAPEGFIYITGIFGNTTDFDPGPGTFNLTASLPSWYIEKLDLNGNFMWVKTFGPSSFDMTMTVSVLNNTNIITSGKFFGVNIDFDPLAGVFLLSSSGNDAYIQKLRQYNCSSVVGVIDSATNVTCSAVGDAHAYALGGFTPYNFSWNTLPTTIGQSVNFLGSGIYTLSVTDSVGCVFERDLFIFGPTAISALELNANLIATNFRPGQGSTIWLDGFNNGCDSISGTLSMVIDNLVNYNYAIPSPDAISGDTLKWNFTSLIYDSTHITPQINVTTSTLATIGDTVCFDIFINPITGDADSSNNFKTYCFPVVASYDPNDKQVYPQGECVPKYVLTNEKLTYTIRFQNTGTADAINIYLLDTLDSNLDLNSVRIIGNSHYVITEVLPGNVLKFRFDNIYLPDSTSDEPNSHGYVIYEVDPLPAVPNNTVINNTAHIFFDFNPAVVTNTISNTLIDTLPNYSSTQNINLVCGSNYVFPDGTIQNDISANTTHLSYFSPVIACDSIVTTNINIVPIDVTVTVVGGSSFTANVSGLSYQWVNDCGFGYTPLIGDTNQTFMTGMEGNFGVIITNGSCSDTSICYSIGSIVNFDNPNSISVYPNPTNNSITISTKNIIANKIELKDVYGRTIKTIQPNSSSTIMDLQNIESGIYFVSVVNGNLKQTVKIVKQ